MQEFILFKVVRLFLENPYREFYLREIAKRLRISPSVAKKYADILLKEKLIAEERKANLRYFRANVSNLFYRHIKIAFNIKMVQESGLAEYLRERTANVSSIVLFGSMAKGEDDQNSDVDLLVIGKKERPDIRQFEEKIGRDISLHIFSWSEWNRQRKENAAFYLDVTTHGIPLYGELPVAKWK